MPLALGAASSVGGSFHQQVAAVCASWSYPHAGINSATRERESSDRRPTDVGQYLHRFRLASEVRQQYYYSGSRLGDRLTRVGHLRQRAREFSHKPTTIWTAGMPRPGKERVKAARETL